MTKEQEIKHLMALRGEKKGDTYFNDFFSQDDIDQMIENIRNDFAIERCCSFNTKADMLEKKLHEEQQAHDQDMLDFVEDLLVTEAKGGNSLRVAREKLEWLTPSRLSAETRLRSAKRRLIISSACCKNSAVGERNHIGATPTTAQKASLASGSLIDLWLEVPFEPFPASQTKKGLKARNREVYSKRSERGALSFRQILVKS